MRAVWYERNGAAEVLYISEMPAPVPKTVLITGGAGAVGQYATQLAKLHGARG